MPRHVDVLAIGAGPSNLALAVALEELAPRTLATGTLLTEQHADVKWHRDMLFPGALSQVSFLKDLVTQRNPRSKFSFLSYLHAQGHLDAFVNLSTFMPYRQEISAYLQWVAHQLDYVQVAYNHRARHIAPKRDARGRVVGWQTHFEHGEIITSRDLILGVGRDPHVPAVFADLPAERVVHSTAYQQGIARFKATPGVRVAVIGSAQSAAEMFRAVHDDLPLVAPTLVMRSIGLVAYEGSKFTNELYYASFVDAFFDCDPEYRRVILQEMHRTNYGGVAPGLLEELYRLRYQQRLNGQEPSRILTMVDVVDARHHAGEVTLTLKHKRTQQLERLTVDLVLLGTGFDPQLPRVLQPLAAELGLAEFSVNRQYRAHLPGDARGALYLQGLNEATHGIADSLLSVLAHRSQDIANDLLARHADHAPTLAHT